MGKDKNDMLLEDSVIQQEIVFFEDTDISDDDFVFCRKPFLKGFYIAQIFASYSGSEVECIIKVLDESKTISLENNSWIDTGIDCVGNFVDMTISKKEQKECFLNFIVVSFVQRKSVQIESKDIIIKHKPEQDISVMFDFSFAIDVARGCDDCLEKQVEIINPQNVVYKIGNKNTSNFFWRDHRLYCKLPLLETHRVKIRFRTSYGWSQWSSPVSFKYTRTGKK